MFSFDVQPYWELRISTAAKLLKRLKRAISTDAPGVLEGMSVRNLWVEMCVQARSEDPLSGLYMSHARRRLDPIIAALPRAEKFALWLGSYEAERLDSDEEPVLIDAALRAAEGAELAEHFINHEVKYALWNDDDPRIRELTGE